MSVRLHPDFDSDDVFVNQFPVHRACRDGDVGTLASLLQQLSNPAHLTAEDSCYGWTPIHWAAHYGQLECVVHLVQMGCEVNVVTSRFSQTPAHTAAFGGHPHCVTWLTQAGADVNRQDCVGETPIHKAARSGSLECIQVLLIAGAEPRLRNASGQTAADLAHAHGFHHCFCFISNAQKHVQRLSALHVNGMQSGQGIAGGQGLLGRKRQLTATEAQHLKKAKRADVSPAALVQTHSTAEEVESMNLEHNADADNTKAVTNGCHPIMPSADRGTAELAPSPLTSTSPPANPHAGGESSRCGSLHLTSSPRSSAPHWPEWENLMGADCGDLLHYGHYHGFGDTAEDLSDGGSSSKQPAPTTIHP
ncbi:ankyrin repeat domain-containing protein 10a [Xenentodon cancila]